MPTLTERILAALLVAFLLVGGVWLYVRLDEVANRPDFEKYRGEQNLASLEGQVRAFEAKLTPARTRLAEAEQALAAAQAEYEFRREEYRTAVEAGTDTPALLKTFTEARTAFEQAKTTRDQATTSLRQLEAAAAGPSQELEQRLRLAQEAFDRANRNYQFAVAGTRLAYLLAVFMAALFLWRRAHVSESRYETLALAFLVFAAIQMVIMAGDYAWHHFSRYAPLLISIAGVAGTAAAIILVRRFLLAPARLGRNRVRRDDCPHCGRTLAHAGVFCPECGNSVRLTCPHCGQDHLVLGRFCPATGRPMERTAD